MKTVDFKYKPALSDTISVTAHKIIMAVSAIDVAVGRGTVKQLPCFCCGSIWTEPHHPDLDQPLQAVWLCRAHRLQLVKEFSSWDSSKKKCSKCKMSKARDQFHKDKHKPDGRTVVCKVCRSAAEAERYERNAEEISKKRKIKREAK